MPLRNFDHTYIDQKVSLSGVVQNNLLYNCEVTDLTGVSLINCDLNQSKILIDDIAKLCGLVLSMNCGSFRNVTLSGLVFDCMVMLLYSTKGNDSKRRKLLSLLGKDRVKELSKNMESIDLNG